MSPTRTRGSRPLLRLFGGKGGVGKTTCAAAAALAAAGAGRRALVVSVDPAHSLGDAFGVRLSRRPKAVRGSRGRLDAVELDAPSAFRRWLDRRRDLLLAIGQRGTWLDEDDLRGLLELSIPGVDELIAFIEIARLAAEGRYAELIVDAAPTGHALRLLAMPAALARIAGVLDTMQARHRLLADSFGAGHRPDAADALIAGLAGQAEDVGAWLRDPARCAVHWITIPEEVAVAETARALARLRQDGVPVRELIVNRVTWPAGRACGFCTRRARFERLEIARIRRGFPRLPVRTVPALDEEPRGVRALRVIAAALEDAGGTRRQLGRSERAGPTRLEPGRRNDAGGTRLQPGTESRPASLDLPATLRLLLFAGKGGVGKTTCAAATALEIAERRPDSDILLLSVDPAPSLGDVLDAGVGDTERPIPGGPANLRVRELDPEIAFESIRARYRRALQEWLAAPEVGAAGGIVVDDDRRIVERLLDLTPPGLDEIVAVLTVVSALAPEAWPAAGPEQIPVERGSSPVERAGNRRQSRQSTGPRTFAYDLIVLDLAPTGHAVRMLETPAAAHAWVRQFLAILLKYREAVGLGEIARELTSLARGLRLLQELIADAGRTRAIVVGRAGELPVLETARLLKALRRLRVALGALVVNAMTPPGCARCRRARAAEARQLSRLARTCRTVQGRECAMIRAPALPEPPRGAAALRAWRATWQRP